MSVFWNMLTTRAQYSYVANALSVVNLFVSLWLQVISLPLLRRRYQQTLEISRGTWPTVPLYGYSEVVVNVMDLVAALFRSRETTKLCKRDVREQYSRSCINCFV